MKSGGIKEVWMWGEEEELLKRSKDDLDHPPLPLPSPLQKEAIENHNYISDIQSGSQFLQKKS